MSDREFKLPPILRPLWEARLALREFYHNKKIPLQFTLDGNLVGDIGEACAIELYGMIPVDRRSAPGIDGYAPGKKKTVQVKAKGITTNAIAFSYAGVKADHLLVIRLDFERGIGQAIYNGPDSYVREYLPEKPWRGQAQVSLTKLRAAGARVLERERLPMLY